MLQAELRRLNLNNVTTGVGIARFHGTLKDGYKAALWTRLGSRVLVELHRFQGNTPDELYEGVQEIPWEEHLAPDGTLWIDFTGTSKTLRHSQFAARRAKDGIVDRFRDKYGVRPSVDKDADLRIHIHLQHALFVISIDLCGSPLHIRTPEKKIMDAPLKETLAAALLHFSGWVKDVKRGRPLLDPMCGSGTIVLEAMGMACNQAANLYREEWNFERWKQHDPQIWFDVKTEAKDLRLSEPMAEIIAQDLDATAIEYVAFNAKQQQLPCPKRIVSPVKQARPVTLTAGTIVCNPPYGERFGSHAYIDQIYQDLGEGLQRFTDWRVFLLCPPNDLYQQTGFQRKGERVTIYNGPLKCRFLELDLNPKEPENSVQENSVQENSIENKEK